MTAMNENMRSIYAILHKPTGKIYVGSSRNVDQRIRSHITQLRRGKHPVEGMQRDYDLYGEDYAFYVLEVAPTDCQRPIRKEYLWMDVFQSRDPSRGYNYRDWTNPFDLKRIPEYRVKLTPVANRTVKGGDAT